MPQIRVWCVTNKVGSKVESFVDIDEEDAEDIRVVEEIAEQELPMLMDWGWEWVDE